MKMARPKTKQSLGCTARILTSRRWATKILSSCTASCAPMPSGLHCRLDRLGADGGLSVAEALEHAQIAHESPQATWTAAGHPGAPPHEQLPASPSPKLRMQSVSCGARLP